ncbi:hypothetical protein CHLRE_01g045800v5 [Chlamydomonas reinhardtii]|uniref:Uncharacterized protein n=1 Tax=Chlamydomonas reinhardtii TaxID=3055 RepID=A0A2K3E7Q5_CHLRE|nr:uncharacterized protein CHLRE_01g045800v5 [Chlamydomonas reinhardtii]PNW88820.1 hypothetical protein CHLRE_01g045800v5 [Chlamydomonas reinhardtii]
MDHFVAKSYVLQPLHVEAPRHLQFWEILKNLLALQVGDGVKRRVCVLSGAPEGELEGDEEEGEEEGEQEGEPDTAEDTPAAAASHTIQGYEAALTGGAVGGRSEYVLVHAPGNTALPIEEGLESVGLSDGLTPLLVAEVKAKAVFRQHIWQPLACALELMKKVPSQPEMWVILTDIETWDFVRVTRLRCTKATAAAVHGAASGNAAAAGGAAAVAATAALGNAAAAAGAAAVAATEAVGNAAPAAGAAAAAATAALGNAAAAAGAAAVAAVAALKNAAAAARAPTATATAAAAGGAAAALGSRYSFKRMDTIHISLDQPSDSYLQLLAVLHHIIYTKEELADLPGRMEKSRGALQTRAEQWVRDAEERRKAAVAKEMVKAEAKVKAAKADAEVAKANAAKAKANAETAKANAAKANAEAAKAKANAAKAKANAETAAAKADAEAVKRALAAAQDQIQQLEAAIEALKGARAGGGQQGAAGSVS